MVQKAREIFEQFYQNHLQNSRRVWEYNNQSIVTKTSAHIAVFPAASWREAFRDLPVTYKQQFVNVWSYGGIVLACHGALLFYSHAAGLVVIPMH